MEKMNVLGVPVSVVNKDTAVARIISWSKAGKRKTVFFRDVHGIMRALDDPALMKIHEDASLIAPDGMPLTWIGRWRGYGRQIGRTTGPETMENVCAAGVEFSLRHFFYGGRPGVAEKMAAALTKKYPALRVVGVYSPPMRDGRHDLGFSEAELNEVQMIRDSHADLIWVGISTPKQEIWISRALAHFDHGVFLGVGAAFDFHAELVRRAPNWMGNIGLEWLYRFISEPGRLWRRYLILAPRFVFLWLISEFRQKGRT